MPMSVPQQTTDSQKLNLSPADQLRARSVIEDTIGPAHEWPCKLSNMFNGHHLKMTERFELSNFLLCNGVHGEWMLAHYRNQSCLRDDQAVRDVEQMWDKYASTGKVFSDSSMQKGDLHFYHDLILGHECLSEPFDVNRHCWAIYKLLGITPKTYQIELIAKLLKREPGKLKIVCSDIENFAKDVNRVLLGRDVRVVRRRVYGLLHEIGIHHCRMTHSAETYLWNMCV